MENPGNRLSKKTLFAYGCGDFASNLCWTFVGSYLSVFYTDVVGMAPAIASMIMLIAKIWDGVNDPMFGMIAERTNSKKRTFPSIYILRCAISGTVFSADIYHIWKRICSSWLGSIFLYWLWNVIYRCKPFLRIFINSYDNQCRRYRTA